MVVLEGWCVGARAAAEDELVAPCNALEAERDPDGEWRRYANRELATRYAALFEGIESLGFLAVPGLDAVRRWRLQQEGERSPEQRLSQAQVADFVEHYERVTRSMLSDLPQRAQWVARLGEDHGVASLALRS